MSGRKPDTCEAVSETVRKLFARMDAQGYRQAHVAGTMGVNPSELSLWRHGHRAPTVRNIEKLADALGVTLLDLKNQ